MTSINIFISKLDKYLKKCDVNNEIYVSDVVDYVESIINDKTDGEKIYEYLKRKGYKKILKGRPFSQPTESKILNEEKDDNIDFFALLEDNKEDVALVTSLKNSYEKNVYLVTKAQESNDEEILEKLIELNMGLVHKEVNRWSNYMKHKLDYDDLLQEGIIGLLQGIERYRIDKGFQLSTYVMHYIRSKVIRAIHDTGHTVRMPVHMFEKIAKLNKIERQALLLMKDKDYVLSEMDINKAEYESLKKYEAAYIKMTSLNKTVSENDDSTELYELLSSSEATLVGGVNLENDYTPEELAIIQEKKSLIQEIIHTLTDREAEVIKYRFGFVDGEVHTLEEVGKLQGVTRERIRQIEAKALRKLVNKAKSAELMVYY